jgi:hypothetical protein
MSWSIDLLKENVGCKLSSQTVHLPSLAVSGGILIASYADFFDIDIIPCASTYSISVRISSKLEDEI